ncbi:MAG TPA: lytic murein transglycosylase [Candidatus Paceibacterota bacterium]|nr:lytic murein transglycosylase [Candidatus Paceibacterota bacterium]
MRKKSVIAFIFVSIISVITISFGISKFVLAADCSDSTYAKANETYCRNELKQIEEQYASLIKQLESQNKKSSNYASEVKKLTTQIDALKAKIKARTLVIAQLKNDINKKVSTIKTLSQKIESEHQSLAQLLRNTNEFDNENMLHLVLSDESISDFYSDLESYSSIKRAIKESVEEITGVKTETEGQKKDLETKQNAELDAKYELESAQQKAAQVEAEQRRLLAASKEKEAAYQKLAAEKKARAEKIRSALFKLAGVADSQAINFGTAVQYANAAAKKTGIDPAFLLAILKQESNLGANVGKCYLVATTGEKAGYSKSVSSGAVFSNGMKPTRDVGPFVEITKRLGLDPLKTVVSCPIAGVAGYGGAMGPAQFIPSTWKLFDSRLKAALGHDSNPWKPQDAFMASAMYLTDLGAVGNSASAQIGAACRYYGSGGTSCSYGTSVMKLKMQLQADIDLLSD